MNLQWKNCVKIGATVFGLYLCICAWPLVFGLLKALLVAMTPLLVGCAIAYVVNVLMSMYERNFFARTEKTWLKKLRRPVCLVGAYLTLIAILVLVVWLIAPQLGSCFQLIADELPDFMDRVLKWVEELGIFSADTIAMLESIDWQSWISTIVSGLGDVVTVLASAVTSVFSAIVSGLVAVIFSIYLLMGKERICGQIRTLMRRYLPGSWCRRIDHVLDVCNSCFRSYIVGQCTEAMVLGFLCVLGMTILHLPYAAMVGALVAVTALIPVAGAWIGAVVGAFLILMVDPFQALVFLIFLLVLQQVENNLIYPKVVGSSIGLPGIWVLAAITVGGGVMGVAGMLVGVPVTAVIYRLLREHVHKKPQQTK